MSRLATLWVYLVLRDGRERMLDFALRPNAHRLGPRGYFFSEWLHAGCPDGSSSTNSGRPARSRDGNNGHLRNSGLDHEAPGDHL